MPNPPADVSHLAPFLALLPTETTAPEETQALGARLAGVLAPGDVVALYGALGTGKTHFVKGLGSALGVDEHAISSPTFTLLQEYAGHLPLYHFDAYRIQHADEFFGLGYEEYFYGAGVCLVEWPDRVEALLPAHTLRLRLTHQGGNRRRIDHATDQT